MAYILPQHNSTAVDVVLHQITLLSSPQLRVGIISTEQNEQFLFEVPSKLMGSTGHQREFGSSIQQYITKYSSKNFRRNLPKL